MNYPEDINSLTRDEVRDLKSRIQKEIIDLKAITNGGIKYMPEYKKAAQVIHQCDMRLLALKKKRPPRIIDSEREQHYKQALSVLYQKSTVVKIIEIVDNALDNYRKGDDLNKIINSNVNALGYIVVKENDYILNSHLAKENQQLSNLIDSIQNFFDANYENSDRISDDVKRMQQVGKNKLISKTNQLIRDFK